MLVAQLYLTFCDPMDCSRPRLLCLQNSLGKNTGVSCHSLLQEIFLTQGSNPGLLHCKQILYHPSPQGSPIRGRGAPQLFPQSRAIPWLDTLPPSHIRVVSTRCEERMPVDGGPMGGPDVSRVTVTGVENKTGIPISFLLLSVPSMVLLSGKNQL